MSGYQNISSLMLENGREVLRTDLSMIGVMGFTKWF